MIPIFFFKTRTARFYGILSLGERIRLETLSSRKNLWQFQTDSYNCFFMKQVHNLENKLKILKNLCFVSQYLCRDPWKKWEVLFEMIMWYFSKKMKKLMIWWKMTRLTFVKM